jgi:membrane peptidoglycan carboxypeptidase
VYSETLPNPNGSRILNPQAMNDLTYALQQVTASQIKPSIGWDTAGKTGTWELNNASNDNAHAWMVGFDKKLAVAVWVGNKAEVKAIKNKDGQPVYGSGLPGIAWKKFMVAATTAMNPKKENTKFNPPSHIGNELPNGAVPSPTPAAPTENPVQPTQPTGPVIPLPGLTTAPGNNDVARIRGTAR